jgi:hypothetical protein
MKFQNFGLTPAKILHSGNAVDTSASILTFLEETDFWVLLLLAVVGNQISQQFFGKTPWQHAAKFLVLPISLIFGYYLWTKYPILNDFGLALLTMARWGLGCWLIYSCFALPTIYVLHFVVRYVQREWARLEDFSKGLQEWHSTIRTPTSPLPVAPPLPPREVDVFRNSEQAKLDYEFECRIVNDAELEAEEREAALNLAKQKYMQRLSQVLQ